MRLVLLDAGPIVALLNPRDPWHEWVRETLGTITTPLFTCEPVLTEASYLLRKRPEAAVGVIELVARKFVRLNFAVDTEVVALRTLMMRYRSVPMSLADACLVRMAEIESDSSVLTLDSDFRTYRRGGRGVIPLIMPQ